MGGEVRFGLVLEGSDFLWGSEDGLEKEVPVEEDFGQDHAGILAADIPVDGGLGRNAVGEHDLFVEYFRKLSQGDVERLLAPLDGQWRGLGHGEECGVEFDFNDGKGSFVVVLPAEVGEVLDSAIVLNGRFLSEHLVNMCGDEKGVHSPVPLYGFGREGDFLKGGVFEAGGPFVGPWLMDGHFVVSGICAACGEGACDGDADGHRGDLEDMFRGVGLGVGLMSIRLHFGARMETRLCDIGPGEGEIL